MKFYSKELQKSFESVQSILESITDTKDRVSADIKEFEKYLKSLSINESLEYTILIPSENVDMDYHVLGISIERVLNWDDNKKRLMYVEKHCEAYIGIVKVIEKPLIETSYEIRKHVYEKHLKNFLLYITDRYKLKENSSDSKHEEIPF